MFMKKLIKYLITDYKKENLFGDMELHEEGYICRFAGQAIRVKILDAFWVTYSYYRK